MFKGCLLHKIFLIVCVTATTSTTAAPVEIANEESKLWQQITNVSKNAQQAMKPASDLNQAFTLLSNQCNAQHPDNILAKVLKAEARQLQTSHGLSFRGGYTSEDLQDKSDDANAYLELSWDLWRQGYTENKHRARSLEYQAKIAELRSQFAQQKLNSRCRNYFFNQAFSGLLSHLLTLKLLLMEPVYTIERRAYFKSWSQLDDLLVSEQDINLLRDELKYLNSNPYLDKSITNVVNLPIIDIDIKKIVETIRNDKRLNEVNQLEKQVLHEKNNYRNKDRLRLFVRKQFDVGNTNDDGVVAGVRFSIPLETKRKLAEEYRLAHIDQKTELQTWEQVTRTRATYQSFREQMYRTIKQQYRYLRNKERVRQSLITKKLDQQILIASAATRVRSLLDSSIELTRAKEELYRRANEVFLIASIEFTPSLIKMNAFSNNKQRSRLGERSIYLWSKGFNKVTNEHIFDFLEAKNIKRVLLTAGKAVQRDKMLNFIKQAREKQIHVESIIGPNKLFFEEFHQQAAIKVEAAMTLSDSVHLDIEPHTFPEYKKNKSAYLTQYINMLKTIRKNSPDINLTVAVPFHWPESAYAKIDKLVNRVYIMAYGNTKPETINRRLQPAIQSISADKIVIVLRVTDFEDEWSIEQMISSLQHLTGLQKYSLHTFRSFVQKAGQVSKQ